MNRDRTVGETFFIAFTTRAFATGVPTVLAGTPVISAYEDAGLTQITAGITLGVDHDGVVGLNMLTIVATGANGYEAGKDYQLVITTGTVGGVSVVGEVIGQFSFGLSASFTRLGAPAGASVSADIAVIEGQTDDIGVAGAGLTDLGGMSTGMKAEVNAEADTALTDYDGPTNTEMVAAFTEIKGATWSSSTDTLEAIRNRGDSAWITATGFSTHSQSDVWSVATRLLTAGTNIVLAKGVGVTGFNDLSAAQVNTEVDTALDTALPASPTAGSINDILDRQEEIIVAGAAATGTLSTTTMTTNLSISVNDQYNGRIITFRKDTSTANLRGVQTDITDTVTTDGQLTFTAIPTAPANGDTFEIT